MTEGQAEGARDAERRAEGGLSRGLLGCRTEGARDAERRDGKGPEQRTAGGRAEGGRGLMEAAVGGVGSGTAGTVGEAVFVEKWELPVVADGQETHDDDSDGTGYLRDDERSS